RSRKYRLTGYSSRRASGRPPWRAIARITATARRPPPSGRCFQSTLMAAIARPLRRRLHWRLSPARAARGTASAHRARAPAVRARCARARRAAAADGTSPAAASTAATDHAGLRSRPRPGPAPPRPAPPAVRGSGPAGTGARARSRTPAPLVPAVEDRLDPRLGALGQLL